MNTQQEIISHKRINITLPRNTLQLLDHITQKGDRSSFVNEAVRFYVKELSNANLKQKLRQGAIARAKQDVLIAEEWFPVEKEIWRKK